MPDNDPYEIYEQLVRSGYSQKDAAKEAQSRTGIALRSGRKIDRSLTFTKKGTAYGGKFIGLFGHYTGQR